MRWRLGAAIAIALIYVLGAAAWGAGATHRFFDYDEIYHAHVTWLIAQGDKPFHDFQGSHTPFLWYPLAALWSIFPGTPATLIPLRFIAALGTLLSMMAMMASFAAVRRELPIAWLTIGAALIAFDRAVADYALEFRPDSWSTALLFFAFFLFLTHRPAPTPQRCACFGSLAGLAVLASPKAVLLPALFVALDLTGRIRRRDDPRAALVGYASGLALACMVAFAFLRIARIDPVLAFDMAIRYQLAFISHTGFHHGLLASVIQQPRLLILVIAGMLAWCAYLLTERKQPSTYELAVLLYLLLELLIVERPYKQYYAPWFILAAGFVPFLGYYAERSFNNAAPWCFGLAIVLSAWTAWSARQSFSEQNQARQMLAFYETLLRSSPADARIVAYPPFHPVVRRDTFYGWSRTTDPGGYGTEAVMRTLAHRGYSERFGRPYYRQELEANPPVLVVAPLDTDAAYEPEQWAALREYLADHRDRYVLIDRDLLRPVWMRPDRVDPATLEQLTGARR